eukprot:CAMPEP_0115459668 /NCGR_PEP_ID=MMETSP0271-20121206/46371_1 /TAXON_ID=71861 /ORGANISM="Scrippsiella trochoidea, Strain CCMP3099" /LENGTH=160 /DNA_ID=CAMNT_0002886319 /DNA_START=145 /DNA_END=627 /DNA_ORIENTATION=+
MIQQPRTAQPLAWSIAMRALGSGRQALQPSVHQHLVEACLTASQAMRLATLPAVPLAIHLAVRRARHLTVPQASPLAMLLTCLAAQSLALRPTSDHRTSVPLAAVARQAAMVPKQTWCLTSLGGHAGGASWWCAGQRHCAKWSPDDVWIAGLTSRAKWQI